MEEGTANFATNPPLLPVLAVATPTPSNSTVMEERAAKPDPVTLTEFPTAPFDGAILIVGLSDAPSTRAMELDMARRKTIASEKILRSRALGSAKSIVGLLFNATSSGAPRPNP